MKSITKTLLERADRVRQFRESNKDLFTEYDRLVTEYEQAAVMLNPTVYISRTRDMKNKDITYFKAKTFYPYPNGKKKEVKIHLGRAEKYDNNTRDPRLKLEAEIKMRKTLARRVKEGTL